jgi:hypothetical protein
LYEIEKVNKKFKEDSTSSIGGIYIKEGRIAKDKLSYILYDDFTPTSIDDNPNEREVDVTFSNAAPLGFLRVRLVLTILNRVSSILKLANETEIIGLNLKSEYLIGFR